MRVHRNRSRDSKGGELLSVSSVTLFAADAKAMMLAFSFGLVSTGSGQPLGRQGWGEERRDWPVISRPMSVEAGGPETLWHE
jgi:hypothetical protein